MNEADAVHVEATLGFALPPPYRDFLVAQSAQIQRDGLDHMLFTDPSDVVQWNQLIRSDDSQYPPRSRNYVVIGWNGAGDLFAVDRQGRPEVWCINGEWYEGADEGEAICELSPGIDSFVAGLIANRSYVPPPPRMFSGQLRPGNTATSKLHQYLIGEWFVANDRRRQVTILPDKLQFTLAIPNPQLERLPVAERYYEDPWIGRIEHGADPLEFAYEVLAEEDDQRQVLYFRYVNRSAVAVDNQVFIPSWRRFLNGWYKAFESSEPSQLAYQQGLIWEAVSG